MENLIRMILTLGVTMAMHGNASSEPPTNTTESDDVLTLDNGHVQVRLDAAEGTFSASAGGVVFVGQGRLGGTGGEARVIDASGPLGAGRAINVIYPNGNADTVALYPGLPFVCISSTLANPSAETAVVETVTPLSATLDLGIPPENLRVLGCDGLTPGDTDRASYSFLAVADPGTRAGVVAGWLTHSRGSGIVFSRPEDGALRVDLRSEYGKLRIPAGQSADSETAVIGYFDDALDGLETYANVVAVCNDVRLPRPIPSGYCTWYSNPHGGASDEASMAELSAFCAKEMTKFGFNTLQIDDQWQISNRDFTTHKPDGPYPNGMKPTADRIKADGMRPGIWYIPFGWDHTRSIFAEHQDWFVHREDGAPYEVHWAGTCLDMTHPEARDFLRGVVSRMARDWGYSYMKVDGLWTGMATKILYPEPAYRDDGLGDAVFHDPLKTNVEAYRDGLALVREAAGEDVFILGCNIAQNMRTLGASFGRVDGMRVGRDIGANWDHILPCVEMGSRLCFFHGRVWYNDPDCLMVREPLTLSQARAWGSWIALTGQLNLVSEWLPGLPPERLDIVKRSMPNHGLCARPVDLFTNAIPQVWHLKRDTKGPRLDVIGLFNWDPVNAATVRVDLNALDLPESESGSYVGFDYWYSQFTKPFADALELTVAAGDCRIIAVRPQEDHPQVLSTSRHITQGAIDLKEESWDAAGKVLSGTSAVVADDPYELRLSTGEMRVLQARVSSDDEQAHVKVRIDDPHAGEARVTLTSPTDRDVRWRVEFR